MKWGIALVIILLSIKTPGYAQDADSALEMQSWCRPFATVRMKRDGFFEMPSDYDSHRCWGAFAAIQQLSRIVNRNGSPMLEICARPTSTRIQYIQIFLQYASQHPEQADMDFAGVARRALAEKFPCP